MNFFLEKKIDKIIFILFFIVVIVLFLALLLRDFNLIKALIFVSLIFTALGVYLVYKTIKIKPREEKTSFFYLVQNLLDVLKEAIVIYDDEKKIVFVNQSFASLVKIKKESLLGLTVKEWQIKNKEYEILANIFFPFLEGEELKIINQQPETISVKFSSPSTRYLLITYLPIELDKKYNLRIAIDKTEDILENEKKLEFIQLASHNLLTPLNELRWQLEAIDKKTLNEENKTLLEDALKIIDNLNILTLSLISPIQKEDAVIHLKIKEVDIEERILFILNLLKIKIESKKIKVEVKVPPKTTIPADPNLITVALFSLIENSIIYNKERGNVIIDIDKMPNRPYMIIKIKDTGIGMSKEEISNLFKKYYRGTKAKNIEAAGFGIGLVNAKKIIENHGGKIEISSEEDKGTEVKVTLPTDPTLIPSLNISESKI